MKVLVTGCFDLLHSGHLQFIEHAANYGDELYVGICSDDNLIRTKNRKPIYTEQERLYMIKSLKWVTDAAINTGEGKCDFENVVQMFKPDILIVNEDGDRPEKAELCKKYHIQYVVFRRKLYRDLPERSTTELIKETKDLAK